ncbi:MAG: PfkB family carbohydrate kinase [Oscillospiraceae bacterium]|nr:PfkB family carbohydrate kinase [Oscillospiraceae bacterium]
MKLYQGIPRGRLEELLDKIRAVRAAVLGDICLDVYWLADMKKSELSRETPHFPLPVTEERMSPGGGGNVAANLSALNPEKVYAVGMIGKDWRGTEIKRLLGEMAVDISHIRSVPDRVTNAYCKPLRVGISETVYEDPRLDFYNDKPMDAETEDFVIASLDRLASQVDVLCVSDQLPFGVVTERIRGHVMKLAGDGLTVVVDSRDQIGRYYGVIIKPNEVEGLRAAGAEDFAKAALRLSEGREVVMTIGAQGSLYAADGKVTHIPARKIHGSIDIVGAGDAFLSGFSLAVAAGASRLEAAFFAGICSEITIQKIGTTGTASQAEILDWYHSLELDHHVE